MQWINSLVYGLFVIWTGLLRGIEAGAYKPNSLWFCMTMGVCCIAGSFLYRLGRKLPATVLSSLAAVLVLAFYLYCFVGQPEKDATVRVGLVIVASIAHLSLTFLPAARSKSARG